MLMRAGLFQFPPLSVLLFRLDVKHYGVHALMLSC